MPKLKYTPKALDDLQRIKAYIVRQFGVDSAKGIMSEITLTARQLELFPEEDPCLEELIDYPTDYRYLVVKPHYIFYRNEGDTVKIIRILNEKQDFLQMLLGISSISEEGEAYFNANKRSIIMPLPKERTYTAEDYWNLPDGERAELIGGKLYAMALPNRIHQELLSGLLVSICRYIKDHGDSCEVYPAPFAVNPDARNENWVEPDLSVICDPDKLTDFGCSGAPDLIIEIVLPSSRRMDYIIKSTLYSGAGVREYWIVDPAKERTTIYRYEEDEAPEAYPFTSPVQSNILKGLSIRISDLL